MQEYNQISPAKLERTKYCIPKQKQRSNTKNDKQEINNNRTSALKRSAAEASGGILYIFNKAIF